MTIFGVAIQFDDQTLNCLRCAHRVFRIVAFAQGRAEDRHHSVTDVLIQSAAVVEDDVGNMGEIVIQDLDDFFGRQSLAETGKTANVGKQNAYLLIDPSQTHVLGIVGDHLHYIGR